MANYGENKNNRIVVIQKFRGLCIMYVCVKETETDTHREKKKEGI